MEKMNRCVLILVDKCENCMFVLSEDMAVENEDIELSDDEEITEYCGIKKIGIDRKPIPSWCPLPFFDDKKREVISSQ